MSGIGQFHLLLKHNDFFQMRGSFHHFQRRFVLFLSIHEQNFNCGIFGDKVHLLLCGSRVDGHHHTPDAESGVIHQEVLGFVLRILSDAVLRFYTQFQQGFRQAIYHVVHPVPTDGIPGVGQFVPVVQCGFVAVFFCLNLYKSLKGFCRFHNFFF